MESALKHLYARAKQIFSNENYPCLSDVYCDRELRDARVSDGISEMNGSAT